MLGFPIHSFQATSLKIGSSYTLPRKAPARIRAQESTPAVRLLHIFAHRRRTAVLLCGASHQGGGFSAHHHRGSCKNNMGGCARALARMCVHSNSSLIEGWSHASVLENARSPMRLRRSQDVFYCVCVLSLSAWLCAGCKRAGYVLSSSRLRQSAAN